jgi:hypothetical protein
MEQLTGIPRDLDVYQLYRIRISAVNVNGIINTNIIVLFLPLSNI